jgi:Ni/Co efflux regulator RcnB
MIHRISLGFCLGFALVLGVTAVDAQPRGGHSGGMPHGEPHAGPRGYSRVTEPRGWNTRPNAIDRKVYNHNYQAARTYHIGPYHPPVGWVDRHWAYGQILPRAYWASQYFLADYWLFGLEVPPVGTEWVRDGDDAILINTANGEILQVEYGVFA